MEAITILLQIYQYLDAVLSNYQLPLLICALVICTYTFTFTFNGYSAALCSELEQLSANRSVLINLLASKDTQLASKDKQLKQSSADRSVLINLLALKDRQLEQLNPLYVTTCGLKFHTDDRCVSDLQVVYVGDSVHEVLLRAGVVCKKCKCTVSDGAN